MSAVIFLDSGPLGVLVNPNNHVTPVAMRNWLDALLAAGRRVILPEIADYEVRRELIRRGTPNPPPGSPSTSASR